MMSFMQHYEPYKRKQSKYFYFTLKRPGENRKYISTGCTTKWQAWKFIQKYIETHKISSTEKTFLEYAEPFFIWETCPRVERRRDEGKSIGKTWVKKCRQWLENHIFKDSFANKKMNEIRKADILDLRSRLKRKTTSMNTINKSIAVVTTILSEAYLREDIDRNPGIGVGNIKYKKAEKDIFSLPELHFLFSEIPGVWGDLLTYCVFNIAAQTGMRCGEILALTWEAVDPDNCTIDICQALLI
jgi:integrase